MAEQKILTNIEGYDLGVKSENIFGEIVAKSAIYDGDSNEISKSYADTINSASEINNDGFTFSLTLKNSNANKDLNKIEEKIPIATTTQAGLMSKEDKAMLKIATNPITGLELSLLANNWKEQEGKIYSQTVLGFQIDEKDIFGMPVLKIENSDDYFLFKKEFGYLNEIVTGENIITFICYKNKPTQDLLIYLPIIRVPSDPNAE